MRTKRGWAIGIALLCAMCMSVFAACNTVPAPELTDVTAIQITGKPTDNTVALSTGSVTLGIASTPAENVKPFSIKWTSNNQAVATVDRDGKLTLLSGGRTTVTAAVVGEETVSDSFTLNVTDDSERNPVTSITITGRPAEDRVEVGSEPIQLNFTHAPADADAFVVEWSSDRSQVATVDAKGLVTVHGAGMANIAVTVKGLAGGGVADSFVLQVGDSMIELPDPVETVTITSKPDNNRLREGATWPLSYSYTPVDCANFDVVWASSDENVATVSKIGEIVAKKSGTAEISLTVKGTAIKDEFTLTVIEPLDPFIEDFESVTLAGSTGSGNYKVIRNNYDNVTCTITANADEIPTGGSGKALKVATAAVAYPGAVLQPNKLPTAGRTYTVTAQIRALTRRTNVCLNVKPIDNTNTVANGSVILEEGASGVLTVQFNAEQVTENFNLEFFAINSGEVPTEFTVDDVTIVEHPYIEIIEKPTDGILLIADGQDSATHQLNVQTNHSDATVVWTSQNTSVATVNSDGKITAIATGTTEITATITVGEHDYTDRFTLTVQRSGVNFTNAPTHVVLGKSATFTVTLSGAATGNVEITKTGAGDVELVRSGADNLTVTVTGTRLGDVTITATAGNYHNSFVLTVLDPFVEDFEHATVNAAGTAGEGVFTFRNDWNNAGLSIENSADGKALVVTNKGDGSYPGVVLCPKRSLIIGAEYTFTATVRSVQDAGIIYLKLENNDSYSANSGSISIGETTEITKTIRVGKETPEILLYLVDQTDKNHIFAVENVTITEKPQVVISNKPTKDTLNISYDTEHQLQYVLVGGAQSDSVEWRSSNTDVATIDADGKLTLVGAGSTTVTMTAGEYSDSFTLTVKQGVLIALENFDDDFTCNSVTEGNGTFTGTGTTSGLTFTTGGWEVRLRNDLSFGSGNTLYWNPYDGDGAWASLNIGVPAEAGKEYLYEFDIKLVNHTKDMEGLRFFMQQFAEGAADNNPFSVQTPSIGFTASGQTLHCSYKMKIADTAVRTKVFLSVQNAGGTQIAIDNFAVYEL